MQAVGPAPVLTHHSSKQEPLNFSRFGDVLNKVSVALVSIMSFSIVVICQLSCGSCIAEEAWGLSNVTYLTTLVVGWYLYFGKDNLHRNNKTKIFQTKSQNLLIFYQNISLLWDFLFILLHWIRYFTTVLYRDLISTKRKLFYDDIIWKFCH